MPDRRLVGLVAVIIMLLFGAVLSASDRAVQGPEVKSHQRAISADQSQQPTHSEPSNAANTQARVPGVLPTSGNREGKAETEQGREKSPEGHAGFLGTTLSAEFIIALFTVLLFVATFALYLATRDLVKGADRTAERQLRAYIGLDRACLEPLQIGKKAVGVFFIKNYGQTPAGNCRTRIAIFITDIENVESAKAELPPDFDVRPTVIFPGSEQKVHFSLKGYADEIDIRLFNAGRKIIALRGTIEYTDVFDKQRSTSVSMFCTSGETTFVYSKVGNHST